MEFKPMPIPFKKNGKRRVAADSVQKKEDVTYGQFIEGDNTDFARIKKEANSTGIQERILARNKALYGQMSSVTDVLKRKKLAEIRKARTELSDGTSTGRTKKFKHIIDVIDPLPVSLDENRPTSSDVALAKSSPSIQLKAAAINNTPTSASTKTYTDATLGEKMKKLYGAKWKDLVDDRFEDPYSEKDKWRWHDGFRVDGSAQVSLEVRSEFVLGAEYTKTSLDTNKEYGDDTDAEGKDIARINKVPLYRWFKRMCDKFDKICKLNYWGQGGLIQHWQYGRAAIVIQDDKKGFPIALKLLNSMRLGRVFVENLTWKVVALEYIDWAPPETPSIALPCTVSTKTISTGLAVAQ